MEKNPMNNARPASSTPTHSRVVTERPSMVRVVRLGRVYVGRTLREAREASLEGILEER